MLCCLLDGHARTSTELAVVAEVSPWTASVQLALLRDRQLVKVLTQGKHRYYSLKDRKVATALEALMASPTFRAHHAEPSAEPAHLP